MTVNQQRAAAISETVAKIRAIEKTHGVSRESLALIKQALLALAERQALFRVEDFPPPGAGDPRNSCLYRVSEDADHRYALYVNSAHAATDAPPHNHTTWAVIVGVQGKELNRFYQPHPDPSKAPIQTGETVVTTGTGAAFLPDDLHSIHIAGDEPVINFHMYGLALEQLHQRQYFSAKHGEWRTFPAHSDIREARSPAQSYA